MKQECCTTNDDKLIVFSEARSKLIVENKARAIATKVIVDGCQITTGKRCDYLLLINDIEIYIELKGQDLKYALVQLESTIVKLSQQAKKHRKKSFIICTRSPLNSATINNYRVKFRAKDNSDLIIKRSPYKHSE
jgi:hypothetical protein